MHDQFSVTSVTVEYTEEKGQILLVWHDRKRFSRRDNLLVEF